jgi:hypothetical protein
MANWCVNGGTLYGPQGLISIVLTDMEARAKRAAEENLGCKLPFVPDHEDHLYCFDLSVDYSDNTFRYETKWAPDPTSLFIMCYALGLTFEGYAEESSSSFTAEYSLTPEGQCLYRALTDEEYEACEELGDDEAADARDNLLTSKPWEPYEIDVSLLKRKVPCPKV